ncbi:hypothetical protein [Lentzea sp. NBRC 102530]|uniref:hypothetical protein n=1 Tax=Lentzea sp. NBRC 102530 TaxID=3032201 RepID=UPI002554EF4E|nr:hypothetical protein [Lentzea sp. NBRC 102530]
MNGTWVDAPVGPRAGRRVTVPGCRTVLVLVPHVVAATRLFDVLDLLKADRRVQVVCTVPDVGGVSYGTHEFLQRHGVLTLPWQQAIGVEFDLVLAASRRDVEHVLGPVLVLPHGAGALKSRRLTGHGLDRHELMRGGRVTAAALVLSHDDELRVLERSCPEAVPHAVVAGDLCLDRMRSSLPHRESYRAALGVAPGEMLVTISSTWRPESVFGGRPELYRADGHRTAVVIHPTTWSVHGPWQVRAWLADRPDLIIIPPEEGWRAAVIASDRVLGDHGSVTQYAAAVGVPVELGTRAQVRPGSLADLVARGAPDIASALSSRLDQAAELLRTTMYRLMRLPEPARRACAEPVAAHHV